MLKFEGTEKYGGWQKSYGGVSASVPPTLRL